MIEALLAQFAGISPEEAVLLCIMAGVNPMSLLPSVYKACEPHWALQFGFAACGVQPHIEQAMAQAQQAELN
jgi:hypothetical protein